MKTIAVRALKTQSTSNCAPNLPIIFRVATVLAALVHPSHLLDVSSWGLSSLPPCCNTNYLG
ncbi:hypothetical protein D8682_21475 [Buttiauxella sp. 3AFRM03]|nr:hypothetical protein D8682_21475 [Buttiauxella sp. 3AFRM03]